MIIIKGINNYGKYHGKYHIFLGLGRYPIHRLTTPNPGRAANPVRYHRAGLLNFSQIEWKAVLNVPGQGAKTGPNKSQHYALEGTKIHPNIRLQMTGFQWKDVTDFCPVIGISPRISQVELALVYPSIPYSSKRQLLEKAAVACMPERSTWGMPTCSFSNPAELLLNIAYKTEEYSSFENLIRNTINKRIKMEDLTRTVHNGEELSWAARDVHRFLALPSRCERKDSELGEIAYLHCFRIGYKSKTIRIWYSGVQCAVLDKQWYPSAPRWYLLIQHRFWPIRIAQTSLLGILSVLYVWGLPCWRRNGGSFCLWSFDWSMVQWPYQEEQIPSGKLT